MRTTYKKYGPMVKRLRRRPLTAESGVRFPLGLPKRSEQAYLFDMLFLLLQPIGEANGRISKTIKLFCPPRRDSSAQ